MESKKKALYKYALTAYLCGSMISGLYATELANEQLNCTTTGNYYYRTSN